MKRFAEHGVRLHKVITAVVPCGHQGIEKRFKFFGQFASPTRGHGDSKTPDDTGMYCGIKVRRHGNCCVQSGPPGHTNALLSTTNVNQA